MTVKIGVEQAGRFKLMISGGKRGTIEYPWQKNLILDAGITRVLSANDHPLRQISVGAGSTAPTVGQTQLESKIASTGRNHSSSYGYNSEGGYGWTKIQVQFDKGAAAGNISELGVGWDGTNLWSRALVLDAEGNPTTITVLSDEFLTVVYELRSWYIVPEPHTITYYFDGVEKETTVTYMNPPNFSNPNTGFASALCSRTAASNIVPLVGMIYGNASINTVEFSITYGIDSSNQGISGINGNDSSWPNKILPFGKSTFCTFTPKIEKTNEFEVTITGTLTMSRRAE